MQPEAASVCILVCSPIVGVLTASQDNIQAMGELAEIPNVFFSDNLCGAILLLLALMEKVRIRYLRCFVFFNARFLVREE